MDAAKTIGHAKYVGSMSADGYPGSPTFQPTQDRPSYGWYPLASEVPLGNDDYTQRVITSLVVGVPDVTPYAAGDLVVIAGEDYVVSEDVRDFTTGPFGHRTRRCGHRREGDRIVVAAGRQFRVNDKIRVRLNNPGFIEMRKDPKLVSILRVRGETWVARLNEELHPAQKARKQPIADGYTYYVHTTGSRARLYIVAFTARAQAHEKKHSSILKLMETTGYDVKKFADLTPQQQTASLNARPAPRESGARPPSDVVSVRMPRPVRSRNTAEECPMRSSSS